MMIVSHPMLLALLSLAPHFAALAAPPAKPPAPPPVLAAPPAMETGANPMVSTILAHKPGPADWYFILDTAGSMLPIAQAARKDIASLVEVMPEGDRVSVVAMHTRPSEALPLSRIDAVNRTTLSQKIAALDLTSAKDVDLGGALSWAVHHLTDPDAANLSFIVMASPFCHSPSVASDYDSGGRGCRPIRGLDKIASTYAESQGGRILATTLIELAPPDGVVDPVGVDAVRKVFPGAVTIDGKTEPFATWAADFRQRLPLQRVLPLAHHDAERTALLVRVDHPPTAESPIATVTLTSGMNLLDLHLSALDINGTDEGETDLRPTASFQVPIDLPPQPFRLLPAEESVNLPIRVTATGELRPADGLSAVGIDPARPALTATGTAVVTRRIGPSWPEVVLAGILGVAFIGMAATLLRSRARKPVLEGQFSYRRLGQARQTLPLAGLTEAGVRAEPNGDLVVAGTEEAILVFRMNKTSLGATAEVEVRREGVEINSKPVAIGVHAVRVGATSLQFDDYRLTWE